ncbi:hypothetical protein GCM10011581_18030 [Saccharopolyspora subtropica]|uniref:Secreted protein n=1 Tax=Saccharopolyspora thermophila TaxID=89367 RepID=A0A917JR54_9PSEU|nr:hypothetical protein [Saccharopolyspora subtropica]GGI81039.1 hypothetical protein GCM10011581_18030 [Saccharopolyspora subtropica]
MRRSPVLFSAAAALAAFAVLPTAPALAASPQAPICTLFANQPTREGNTLVATGGRIGCRNTATVTVRLMFEQQDATAKVLGELVQSGTEINLAAKAPCTTGGQVRVHTETRSSTGAVYRSPSVTFDRC